MEVIWTLPVAFIVVGYQVKYVYAHKSATVVATENFSFFQICDPLWGNWCK